MSSIGSPQRKPEEGSRAVRIAVEQESIMAGAWEADVVDRVIANDPQAIKTENGKIAGVKNAVEAYRQANPDGFIKLSSVATNEKLPATQRFGAAYREILKARSKRTGLARAQAAGIAQVRAK